jgi:hypothetical protein
VEKITDIHEAFEWVWETVLVGGREQPHDEKDGDMVAWVRPEQRCVEKVRCEQVGEPAVTRRIISPYIDVTEADGTITMNKGIESSLLLLANVIRK